MIEDILNRMLAGGDFAGLVRILNTKTKRELEKTCRDIVINHGDFAAWLLAARLGRIAPYEYAAHFSEHVPDHLKLSDEDLVAMSSNGVGPMQARAQKTMRKVVQTFADRRISAYHLLYVPRQPWWFLFYFDQRDWARRDNHWQYGSHVHILSHHWSNLSCAGAWREVKSAKPKLPKALHIRYVDREGFGADFTPAKGGPASEDRSDES